MKKSGLVLVLISVVIGSFAFGANMPLLGRGVVANRENAGENVEYAMQVTLARVINELELTNEQLLKILTEARSARVALEGFKQQSEETRGNLLNLLVERKVQEAQDLMSERKDEKMAATLMAEYVNNVKKIFTYEQGEKLERLFNRFVTGAGNPNTRINQLREEFAEQRENGVQSQRLKQLKEGIQKRVGGQEGQPRIVAKTPQVLNHLTMSFLTDWGMELIERFIVAK